MSGMVTQAREDIADGHTALGIELGSTRIKAVLTGPDHAPIAVGSHDWENQFVDRTWTYSLEAVWSGLQQCYAAMAEQVRQRYDVELTSVGALGVSAMMHGYLAFDADGELLTPFRTWRNTNTGQAAERLSTLFGHNIPHRWSVAQFDQVASEAGLDLRLADLLPTIRQAGEVCGQLTAAGAELLDPTGRLSAGVTMCPKEGDAGTGMVATNSVAPRTGNVSAGTSIFAMVVLERELSQVHRELDLVTTPAGDLVAMVHCNNGASELNSWVGLFAEFARALGTDVAPSEVFGTLFTSALGGASDCGGMLAYNYLSGEPITGLEEGRPLFVRSPDSGLGFSTFM